MDLVEAMVMIMESDINGEIFNVGNPANILTIKELADMIVSLTKSESEVQLIDSKKVYGKFYAEAWNKIPDIKKIQDEIGWNPKYDIKEILSIILEDQKK